jgi:hypothetical protein
MNVNDEIRRLFHITCDPRHQLPHSTGRRYGDRNLLPELCKRLGYKEGAEIGVRKGDFSEVFCKAGMTMHCIDPWEGYYAINQRRMAKYYEQAVARLAKYDVTIIRRSSVEAVTWFEDGQLDFVFIDGDHRFDAVMMDLLLYVPKVRSGGLIMLHDYHGECRGVMLAVDAYTRAHRIDPWYVLKTLQPSVFWENP